MFVNFFKRPMHDKCSLFCFRSNPLDEIDGILSGVEWISSNGSVMRASALLNIWLLNQNGTKDPNGELIDPIAMEWEKTFIQQIILEKVNAVPEGLRFDALAERR